MQERLIDQDSLSKEEAEDLILSQVAIKRYDCVLCGRKIRVSCTYEALEEFKEHKPTCDCGVELEIDDSMVWN